MLGFEDIEHAAIGAAAFAAVAGVVWGLIRARTDWASGSATRKESERDEIRELLTIKDEVIEALREQNAQAAAREAAWGAEREDYKRRLDHVEEAFRSVVVAVVNAGICASAPTCENYVAPGERRSS